MKARQEERRKSKLVGLALQLKLVASLLSLALFCMLVQALLFRLQLARTAGELGSSGELVERVPSVVSSVFVQGLLVALPAAAILAVLVTFRVAGPVRRFEDFLARVARGEEVEPCSIRKRDELQELCRLINAATEPARRQLAEEREERAEREEREQLPPLARAG